MREFGDQGAENKTVETWRAVEVSSLGSRAAHRRATCITGTSGRQQWAEPRLEAVRKGQVGQTGFTDFGPRVERFSGPCEKGK